MAQANPREEIPKFHHPNTYDRFDQPSGLRDFFLEGHFLNMEDYIVSALKRFAATCGRFWIRPWNAGSLARSLT